MNCRLTFLPVGNADSIILCANDNLTILIDIGNAGLLNKWLQQQQIKAIERIYISHAHGDHCPSLVNLVQFIKSWLKQGKIKEICLPYNMFLKAKQNLLNRRNQISPDKALERIETALNQLDDWDKKNIVNFLPMAKGSKENYGEYLKIFVLHPRQLFIESHLAQTNTKLNELSLVLKVSYGDFTALLLADLEGDGLRECLEICPSEELKANIVKIPHHGAYPRNGEDLQSLLETIDPELAILSVGSTNNYGHVMPQLFSLLLNLKTDNSKKLKDFLCTEVTRTCTYSNQEIAAMNRSGLKEKKLCAGEITILANISGEWNIRTETIHNNIIAQLDYPACQGKLELI
ncbi:hypothetical protein [Crocosphaera sp. XPORK-15E]|uniref:ComEC/Rec2 family competence protein n=1 Tax=Crocosphaera sp. XPORK-15E TaxID=3110247 RepID=UPI002B1F8CFA|nr:hypothetical protein [Crocosphaera sp. XPORK-15E]MEA5535016.1 hypothetical protein [Crocosphaera sp. XPORK-15E]